MIGSHIDGVIVTVAVRVPKFLNLVSLVVVIGWFLFDVLRERIIFQHDENAVESLKTGTSTRTYDLGAALYKAQQAELRRMCSVVVHEAFDIRALQLSRQSPYSELIAKAEETKTILEGETLYRPMSLNNVDYKIL